LDSPAVRKKALENGLAFSLGACMGVLCFVGEWVSGVQTGGGGQREWWSEGVVVKRSGGRREWRSVKSGGRREWWSNRVVVVGGSGGR
jgi:hypothetical protein